MAEKVEAVRVSPFIKFCRWGLLLAGISYGATRYETLSKKQKAIRDSYEQTRPERQAKMAAERKRKMEEDLEMINNLMKSSKTA